MFELAISDSDGEVIDVGQFAAPQLLDVDGNGELDLIIGEKNGSLKLYLQCLIGGETTWCLSTTEENGSNWAGIQANQAAAINGFSTPCLYTDGSGIHMMIGNELGAIQYFGVLNTENILDPLVEITNAVGNYIHGARAAASFADVNADGYPEMLIGIHNGGIRWHQGVVTDISTVSQPDGGMLYPNPVRANNTVRLEHLAASQSAFNCNKMAQWIARDGRIYQAQETAPGSFKSPKTPGIYILVVTNCDASEPEAQLRIPVVVVP
jgi:hypothetical protein